MKKPRPAENRKGDSYFKLPTCLQLAIEGTKFEETNWYLLSLLVCITAVATTSFYYLENDKILKYCMNAQPEVPRDHGGSTERNHSCC